MTVNARAVSSRPRSIRVRQVASGGALATLLVAALHACADDAPPGEPVARSQAALDAAPAYYYRSGKRVEVRVASDAVALVASGPGAAESIRALVAQNNAEISGVFQESLYVVRPRAQLDRTGLEKLAARLEALGRRYILESGLVAREGQDPSPALLPDQFIARFDERLSAAEIAQFNADHGVNLVGRDPFAPNQYLLQVRAGHPLGVLAVAAQYEEDGAVRFAHPNFWRLHTTFDQTPFDPFFTNQWHHKNTGQSAGLVDADADTSWAWDYGYGDPDVVIAVVDQGVDLGHADLASNIYVNGAEIAGNGLDDDGNGLVDDVRGWDFGGCGASVLPCGDSDANPALADDSHGTAVAGVAAARGNNATGVVGACPSCKIMPLRVNFPTLSDQGIINVFHYIALMGPDVVNNSWGHSFPYVGVDTAVADAIADAASGGSLIVFAAGNGDSDGWCEASYPSLNESVMAVSSSTNLDRKVTEAAWGDCVDVLAPSHRGYFEPYNGTLNITTTDRTGTAGYNNADPPPLTCAIAEPGNMDYTHCFGGTSSAAPLVAGIAGLVKSANGTLDRTEIQRLIQDTADKIVDSVADYDADTGFSTPRTHSYGRVNAFEAVRVAATSGLNAHADVDLFLRDNELDWGNTSGYLGEQSSGVLFESPRSTIGHWRSRDIKVDAPPYQTAPTALTYDAFVDEKPSLAPGDVNRVYVRVHNRGHQTASAVDVKVMWTQFGTSLPAFPGDFWTSFPLDSASPGNPWTSAACQGTTDDHCTLASVGYGAASVAGTAADGATIAAFDMAAPSYDPSKANHYCLLAIADSPDDRVDSISQGIFAADSVTPNDNNVTHRNYTNLDTSVAGAFDVPFYIRNPFEAKVRTRIIVSGPPRLLEATRIDPDGFAFNEVFTMPGHSEKLVRIKVQPNPDVLGELEISQQNYGRQSFQTVGGLTLDLTGKP